MKDNKTNDSLRHIAGIQERLKTCICPLKLMLISAI